jgi:porin
LNLEGLNPKGSESVVMSASSGDRTKLRAFALSLALSAMSACVGGHAADAADLTVPIGGTSPPPAAVPWLLGDWNGARTRLVNAGIDFQFGYTSEVAGNATGGQRQQVAYTDQWVVGTTFDLTRLGVLPGGHGPGHLDRPQRQQSER